MKLHGKRTAKLIDGRAPAGAWIETDTAMSALMTPPASRPTWARGLKHITYHLAALVHVGRAHVGAWIETTSP